MSQQLSPPTHPTTKPIDKPTGKYGAMIQKARSLDAQRLNEEPENQETEEPQNQISGLPETDETEKESDVNLSIKVSKRLRRHWVAEAKRRDTTLTAVIIAALTEKFGHPSEP